jgi:hypothetical protein
LAVTRFDSMRFATSAEGAYVLGMLEEFSRDGFGLPPHGGSSNFNSEILNGVSSFTIRVTTVDHVVAFSE